jgi:hypothetical protein
MMTYTKNELLTAIEKGIKKWESVVAGGPEYGAKDCALCQMFLKYNNLDNNSCDGCPIYLDTHRPFCEGTPYVNWTNGPDNDEDDTNNSYSPKQIQSALDMVTYLNGLFIRFSNDEIKMEES